jgi:hypothetical protein
MRQLLRPSLIALLLLLENPLRLRAISYFSGTGLPEWVIIGGVIVFLLIVYKVLDVIVFSAMYWPFLRKQFFPFSKLEGFWYTEVVGVGTRPHSIAQIKYDRAANSWIYEGNGYSSGYEVKASWESRDFDYDQVEKFWLFKGHSRRLENRDPKHKGNVIAVLYVGTAEPRVGKPDYLVGRVLDLDLEDEVRGFRIYLYRIPHGTWKSVGIKRRTTCLNDPEKAQALITLVRKQKPARQDGPANAES